MSVSSATALAQVVLTQVVLYDLLSKLQPQQWSPNSMKIRALLNYKGIPFTTKFVTYIALHKVLRAAGVEPRSSVPPYTVPTIEYAGEHVMDSDKIREFLNERFPDTPVVHAFPPGGSLDLEKQVMKLKQEYVVTVVSLLVYTQLLPEDLEYFMDKKIRVQQVDIRPYLADPQLRATAWEGVRTLFNSGWFQLFGGTPATPYFQGALPQWIDFVIFGIVFWAQHLYEADPDRPTIPLLTDPWVVNWYGAMSPYAV